MTAEVHEMGGGGELVQFSKNLYFLQEIDSYIAKASDQGYTALLKIGSRGLNYATNIVVQTAIKVWRRYGSI